MCDEVGVVFIKAVNLDSDDDREWFNKVEDPVELAIGLMLDVTNGGISNLRITSCAMVSASSRLAKYGASSCVSSAICDGLSVFGVTSSEAFCVGDGLIWF
jgi:hypothetical protein